MIGQGPNGLRKFLIYGDDEGRLHVGGQEVVEHLPDGVCRPLGREFVQVGEVHPVRHDVAAGDVVRVAAAATRLQSVIGGQDDLRAVLADQRGHHDADLVGVFQACVPQVQDLVDVQLEVAGGALGLFAADLRCPAAHVPFGQDDHSGPVTSGLHLQQERPRPDLGVVRVRAKRQEMEWL